MIELSFESNYRDKILHIKVEKPASITSKSDVLSIRTQWTGALSSWHSPYKALVDFSNILETADTPEIKEAFESLARFFKGFYLRKAAIFGTNPSAVFPFEVFPTEEEASDYIGIRTRKAAVPGDFRSSLQFENHFRQHVVELSFSTPVQLDSEEKLKTLKDKLTNNLMQWHSSWNLLIDCTNLETVDEALTDEFAKIERYFKSFFMKKIIGYSPHKKESAYPFKVFRSRHKAAAMLENEGLTSGEDANCSSRK